MSGTIFVSSRAPPTHEQHSTAA